MESLPSEHHSDACDFVSTAVPSWAHNMAQQLCWVDLWASPEVQNRWVLIIHSVLLPMRRPKFREVTWHAQSYTAGQRHSWGLNLSSKIKILHLYFVFPEQSDYINPETIRTRMCLSNNLSNTLISWRPVKGRASSRISIQRGLYSFLALFFP